MVMGEIRDLRWKILQKETMITETRKKLKRRKNRKAVRISTESVQRGARCLWRV